MNGCVVAIGDIDWVIVDEVEGVIVGLILIVNGFVVAIGVIDMVIVVDIELVNVNGCVVAIADIDWFTEEVGNIAWFKP